MEQRTLKQHRMRAYLTVQALAERAGVSTDTIWRIQKGEKPKPATVWKITEVLGVHPNEVVEFANSVGYEQDESSNNGLHHQPSQGAPPVQEPSDFWKHHDPAVLIAQQGTKPVTDFNQLLGDFWPENETSEEFLEWLYESRRAGG